MQLGYVDDDALAGWLARGRGAGLPVGVRGIRVPAPRGHGGRGAGGGHARSVPCPRSSATGPAGRSRATSTRSTEALVSVLGDADRRAALVDKGRCRAARFTWEECGAGLAELYSDAAGAAARSRAWTTSERDAPGCFSSPSSCGARCRAGSGPTCGACWVAWPHWTDSHVDAALGDALRESRAQPSRSGRRRARTRSRPSAIPSSRRGCPVRCSRGCGTGPSCMPRGASTSCIRCRWRCRRVPTSRPGRRCVEVVAIHDVAWRHRPEDYPSRGRRWHEAALGRALRRADAFRGALRRRGRRSRPGRRAAEGASR